MVEGEKKMNPEKFAKFSATYRASLEDAVTAHAEKYAWPVEDAPKVAGKMLAVMEANPRGVNYDGDGMKRTCKALGIKATRKAIFEFLEIEKKS